MTIPTETLEKWLRDAKRSLNFISIKWMYHAPSKAIECLESNKGRTGFHCFIATEIDPEDGRHIENSQPQNFAALIEEVLFLRSKG